MTVGSLFSGIGGFDLGFERAGYEIRWQVEIDDYCNRVLEQHWPHVRRHRDVRAVHAPWSGHACDLCLEPVDLICGGFPCQPHSLAGRRQGAADDRDLWPQFSRLIRALRPQWVVAENVPGLLSNDAGRFFGGVLRDLAESGYDAEWDCLPASAFGAPHIRDRVWLVAYPSRLQPQPRRQFAGINDTGHSRAGTISGPTAGAALLADDSEHGRGARWPLRLDSSRERQQQQSLPCVFSDADRESLGRLTESRGQCGQWESEPNVGRVADGIPARVDRLRGLGNSIVPQIAEWIARRILEAERLAA